MESKRIDTKNSLNIYTAYLYKCCKCVKEGVKLMNNEYIKQSKTFSIKIEAMRTQVKYQR